MTHMTPAGIGERAARVLALRVRPSATAAEIASALIDVRAVRAWADAQESGLVAQLSAVTPFPENIIADANRCSLGAASMTKERSDTLSVTPSLASALSDGVITAGHVDAVTRASKKLDDEAQRSEFIERADSMMSAAVGETIDEFGKRLDREINRMRTDDGEDRLTRQRRDVRVRTWTDGEGMWNLRGRFDPVSAISLHAALTSRVDAMFSAETPELCPTDPREKNGFLAAHALARLMTNAGEVLEESAATGLPGTQQTLDESHRSSGRRRRGAAHAHSPSPSPTGTFAARTMLTGLAGDPAALDAAPHRGAGSARRPEYLAVIDADTSEPGAPHVEYAIPVELPERVIGELAARAEVVGVVVRNGVVLHAPGRIDLGRTTRLANRAQRRALRALYRSCAIPGCSVEFDRCKVHHVVWWRNGGATDLANLLPVCSHHHSKIHDAGWAVTLGPKRELTLRLPDGQVRCAGPPSRRSAA
ncbi:MAG: HNH endonuclease signature motif containing protein [Ilumatobacter sp.]